MKRFPAVLAVFLVCVSPSFCEQRPPYLDTNLPTAARVKDLISSMTLEEKVSQIAVPSEAIDRLGVPAYDWRGECLHGQYLGDGVTCFPQAIGMAATFDTDLIHQVAAAISDESVALHYELARQGKSTFRANFTYWSPNINLYRDPRWGRGQETYGEDPYLVSIMGVNFVRGLQGDDPKYLKVASAPKHYAVHSGPDEIRTHFRAEVNPHDFWDTYMPGFEAAVVEGKAAGIMAAYSGINGVPCHANRTLLDTILRKTWGFDGFVVSDGGGVGLLETKQLYTKNAADTAKVALMAGVDLENQRKDYPELVKLVRDKEVPEARIDEALTNLLTCRFRVGMFDPPELVPYTKLPYSLVGAPEHRRLALKMAQESIVLLKNSGVLPLAQGKYKRIAVIGPAADSAQDLYGNYFGGKPNSPVSLLEGIRKAAGPGATITHSAGCGYTEVLDSGVIPSAVLIPAGGKAVDHGLRAEYFDNPDLQGKPLLTRIDAQIDFDWDTKSPTPRPPAQAKGLDLVNVPADHFSVRWTGKLAPVDSGRYSITLSSDDGSRLYLDGKLVIDNWKNGAKNKGVSEVELEAGKQYDLRVEYFESANIANVRLSWKNTTAVGAFADALRAAKDADVVVATVGMRQNMSSEGRDWNTYALPPVQQRLLESLKTAGKPMVVVLIGGNPIDLNWEHQNADALLQAWFPGEEGGTAVGDVLFGTYNPSGRLPVTYYKSISQVPDATDYAMKDRTYRYFTGEVLYPFGYGLSYTRFTYSGLKITPGDGKTNVKVTVTASVTNAGSRAGDEVAQLYVSKDARPGYAPLRQLKGIQRVNLKPGETRKVRFALTPTSLALVNERGDLVVDAGSYTLWVGGKQPEAKSIADATSTGIVTGKLTLSGSANYLAKDRPFPH
jgi:beta-glucosidase